MAKVYSVNTTPATGSATMFDIKETLKSAGWTVSSSSDGTTYNASGDQITHAGSGAGGMANSRAWFRIQDPGGRREYCIQKSTSDNIAWRIKYSASQRFVAGSPDATVTPSASDEGILLGAGSDASPTFASLFSTDNSYKSHIVAMNVAEGNVYSFWWFSSVNGTGTLAPGFFCEALDVNASSSVDEDRCVTVAAVGSVWNSFSNDGYAPYGWYRYNLSGAAFGRHSALVPYGAAYFGNEGTDAYEGKDTLLPPLWAKTNLGVKGASKFMMYSSAGASRAYPDTVNLATDAYVYMQVYASNCALIPWPEGVTPLV